MECAIKTGLWRRFSRRVNMIARRNPARAPRNPSVIERLESSQALAGQEESGVCHTYSPEHWANLHLLSHFGGISPRVAISRVHSLSCPLGPGGGAGAL